MVIEGRNVNSAAAISDSVRIQNDVPACEQCGSTSQVGRGFCLNCLLQRGLGADTENTETLEDVLNEVDVRDADWRIGNYQILEEIGRGGMGVIYRARQRHSRRIVALKRILSFHADSRETLARFRREAEAAASLDHPNILPIYEVSESDDGLPFFSMKFAAGGSLVDVARTLRHDPRQIVRLIAKVTRAVQHAHAQGILHRDIKPGNILLDGRGEPLVSDFGLAKWLDANSDLTRTLTIFGTPGYIAPEQAQGPAKNLTAAADTYSIGAVLFDLFTGRPPFLGEHALSVIKQAADKPAPKLRTLAASADRDLETICARCLEREPHARYRSAGDLAEDLERWLEGRPIIARPVSAPVRVWRWSKRNPKLATSLAVCAVLAASAGIWLKENRRLEFSVREGKLAVRSIGVLPFLNLDTGRPDEHLGQTTAETWQIELSKSAPAKIVPILGDAKSWLAGAGEAKDITAAAAGAKVRSVLTGTVRTPDGKTRITLRLLNGASGELLLRKIFESAAPHTAMSESLRTAIPEVDTLLRSKTWPSAATSDPGLRNQAAHDFLISGRQLMFRATVADIDRAIGCFERALQIEPDSATAHAFLASALGGRNHYAPDRAKLERAEGEARSALRLDPNSADAHRALGGVFYQEGHLAQAQEEQFQAVEAGGTEERIATFIGLTSVALGEPVRALGWLEMAKHWATLPGDYDALIGNCWTLLLEDGLAEAAYRRFIDLRPESPDGWVGLSHLKLRQGDFEGARKLCHAYRGRFETFPDPDSDARQLEALIEFFARNYKLAEERYRALSAGNPTQNQITSFALNDDSALARLLQLRGDNETARRMLELAHSKETVCAEEPPAAAHRYRLAAIESCLGNKDGALRELRAAIAAGWLDIRSLQIDPRFDALSSDKRFSEISETLRAKIAKLKQQVETAQTQPENHENTTTRLE